MKCYICDCIQDTMLIDDNGKHICLVCDNNKTNEEG